MHHLSLSEKVQAFCAESASSNPNSNLAASNVGAGGGRMPNNNGLIPTNIGKLQAISEMELKVHSLFYSASFLSKERDKVKIKSKSRKVSLLLGLALGVN